MRAVLCVACLCSLLACGEKKNLTIPSIIINPSDFSIKIPAKGELISAKETPINVPMTNTGPLILAWIKAENSRVKAGEVVARFDGQKHLHARDKAQLELDKNHLTQKISQRKHKQQHLSLHRQTQLIEQKLAIAERFSVNDLRIYSKNEIIDQLMDKEFLTAKKTYLEWKNTSLSASANTELALLSIKAQGHSNKIEMHQSTLNQLEIKAPQDGVLIYYKNWRGEKPHTGHALFPGTKVAGIPTLDTLRAKLYVLENEAINMQIGQPTELYLDAYPEHLLQGKILQVASIAAPKERDNPVKYFELVVELDSTDSTFMMPGQKLTATVFPSRLKHVFSVPNQAVFQDKQLSYVYVKQENKYNQRPVKTGQRSLTRVQIISGIASGEQVALMVPKQ